MDVEELRAAVERKVDREFIGRFADAMRAGIMVGMRVDIARASFGIAR